MILSKGSGFVTTSSSSHLSPSSLSDFLSFSQNFSLFKYKIISRIYIFRLTEGSSSSSLSLHSPSCLFFRAPLIFRYTFEGRTIFVRSEWLKEWMINLKKGIEWEKTEERMKSWLELERRWRQERFFGIFSLKLDPDGKVFVSSTVFFSLSLSSLTLLLSHSPHSFCCSFCTNCLCIQANISIYSRSTINRNKLGRNNWVQTGVKG